MKIKYIRANQKSTWTNTSENPQWADQNYIIYFSRRKQKTLIYYNMQIHDTENLLRKTKTFLLNWISKYALFSICFIRCASKEIDKLNLMEKIQVTNMQNQVIKENKDLQIISYTNANLNISLFVLIYKKIIPENFTFLIPKVLELFSCKVLLYLFKEVGYFLTCSIVSVCL